MQLRKNKNEISIHEIENFHSELMESQEELHLIDEKEIELQQLEKALHNLNEEQKKCVDLFYIKEKSYQEVVDETGYELKKVKSYIQNGKRNLMLQLTRNKTTIILLIVILNIFYHIG